MIDLELEKDMLCQVQDVGPVRGIGRGHSDHHIVLCKIQLVRGWITRREVVVGVRLIDLLESITRLAVHAGPYWLGLGGLEVRN